MHLFGLGHVGLPVDHVDCLVDVFHELLESLLREEYLVGFVETEDIEGVGIMPDDSRVVLLSQLEVPVAILRSDDAEHSSLIADVGIEGLCHQLGLAFAECLGVDDLYLSLS